MKTKSTTKIAMMACALFMGTCIFFSCSDQGTKEQLEKIEFEKQELQKQFDSIMFNHEKVKSENNLYAEQFAEKDSVISVQAARIKSLLAELSARQQDGSVAPAPVPTTKTSKLREQIKELQATCDNYMKELETLKAENEALKAENEQMRAAMEETKEANEKLVSENQSLEQKIENAKRLVTTDVTATPMRKKCGGKGFKETKQSKKLETVKIEARILQNDVVDPGTKTVYARITGPNNRVLCNGTAEEFSFDIDGSPLQYTAKQDIEFDGSARKVVINWSRNDNVKVVKGNYRVTLYADGQEIGKTSFKLTK
jgi:hypothetical protein